MSRHGTQNGHGGFTRACTGRFGRRRLLSVGGGVLAGAGLLSLLDRVAPVRQAIAVPSAAAATARTELRFGISVDPGTPGLPLLISGGLVGLSQSINHVTETLVIRDERMQTAPGLAERWQQIDPVTWQFELRRGVKFHNGEPFDSQSVKTTLDNVLAPRSRAVWKAQIQAVKEVIVVSPYVVAMKTAAPYRPLIRMIANVPMMPPKALEQLGDKIATTPIGTGPYRNVQYVPGDHWTVEANPDYWGVRPRIPRVTWKYVRDDDARVSALLAGDVDVINNVPPDRIDRLRQSQGVTVKSIISTFIIFVGMRVDRSPFMDRRVRQALNYAIDKHAIADKILFGAAQVADSPLAPSLPYRRSLGAYPYDPDKARAILKDAGYNGATATPVLFGTAVGRYIRDREVGEAVSGYLDAVGFKHRLETPDFPTYISEVSAGGNSHYDMFLLGYGPQSIEPDQLLSYEFESQPNLNAQAYKNPQVDALLAQGRETFDDQKLRQIYGDVTRLIWTDAPCLWLYYQPEITGFTQALKGYGPRADSFWYVGRASW